MIFTCPFCSTVSTNSMDAQESYCRRCAVFVQDVLDCSPVVRRTMAKFCRCLAQTMDDEKEAAERLRTAAAWEFGLPPGEQPKGCP